MELHVFVQVHLYFYEHMNGKCTTRIQNDTLFFVANLN